MAKIEYMYTVEYITASPVAVKVNNNEEWAKCVCIARNIPHPDYSFPWNAYPNDLCVQTYQNNIDSTAGAYCDSSFYKDIGYEVIDFSQINFNEFKLPEKWCIHRTPETAKQINDWFNRNSKWGNNIYMSSANSDSFFVCYPESEVVNLNKVQCDREGYKEITFEQFKKYVLKEQIMEKKIIGYNLIDKKNEAVFRAATGLRESYTPFIVAGHIGYYYDKKAKELGVQDWFEPVYEDEFKVGDWVKVVNNTSFGFPNGTVAKILYIDGHGGARVRTNNNTLLHPLSDVVRATAKEIEDAQRITIGGYDINISEGGTIVTCGGHGFTKEELYTIRRVVAPCISGTINIKGTPITLELINRITEQMKDKQKQNK